jgi:alkyldihydroxyacetonephosphate synthase
VITGARLRVHPAPGAERRDAWSFGSFEAGLDACRRILRRGATPAVLRLYDDVEANRSYQTGDRHVLLVYDEGDAAIIDGVMRVVAEECGTLAGGAGRGPRRPLVPPPQRGGARGSHS